MEACAEHCVDDGVIPVFSQRGECFIMAVADGECIAMFCIRFKNGEAFTVDRCKRFGRVEQDDIDRPIPVDEVPGEDKPVTSVVSFAADDQKMEPVEAFIF